MSLFNFNPTVEQTLISKRISLFMQNPTIESLLEDIKSSCYDLLLTVNTLDAQKQRVLVLDEKIKMNINYFKSQSNTQEALSLLNTFKSFILITNRTLNEFNIQVQITIKDSQYKFSLRD